MTDHVIVLPGGGYQGHAAHEAEPVAEWLDGLGLSASVFRYPVHTRHPGVIDAVRGEIRARRAEGATRIGLLGFSAGGHAAGHAAFAATDDPAERVDLVVLGYPVVSMELPSHEPSRQRLLGRDADAELRRATSVDRLVADRHADGIALPDVFVWHTADDDVVPVEHAYLLGQALAAAGAPHELHVYPHGRHGLGLADESDGGLAAGWTASAAAWLRDRGWAPAVAGS